MMSRTSVVVEACVTSPEEAVACFDAGADRAELCHDLTVGGLTPRTEDVSATLSAVPGPIVVLVEETGLTEVHARAAAIPGVIAGLQE